MPDKSDAAAPPEESTAPADGANVEAPAFEPAAPAAPTDQTTGPGEQAGDSDARYRFEIDPADDSTHGTVVRMVGSGRRVLELGPATGYMTKVLTERGCSVTGIEFDPAMAEEARAFADEIIVGDLDTLDLDEVLGGRRFDAIIAADVLEHLRDPLGLLRRLRDFLDEGGFFVVSLPNVAHGSVRLALLQGQFEYSPAGLLDSTHLRFFTRESVGELFDDAELAIAEFKRSELDILASEVPFDRTRVPADLLAELEADPDARTYQFVLRAYPLANPGMREMQSRMREQALEITALGEELVRLRAAHREMEPIIAREAAVAARLGDLREALLDAHDQLLVRDEQLLERDQQSRELAAELAAAKNELGGLIARTREAESQNAELWKAQNEAREIIAMRDEEIHRLRVRLERILTSPPIHAWSVVSDMPGLRRVKRWRAEGYSRAVSRHPE